MSDNLLFGERLRRLREENGLSRAAFSELLDIPQPSLYAYEMKMIEPSVNRLVRIATRCNVSIDWLCGLSDSRNFAEELERMTETLQCMEFENENWNQEI